MKCWKCGNDMTVGASKCLSCGADQNRSIPKTDIGRAMRQLYDRYGRDIVLQKSEYLDKGLGDIVVGKGDSSEDTLKVRRWIRIAMDAGLGKLYLDQLNASGTTDDSFIQRATILMTEDAGLSSEVSEKIIGLFDEMIGWKVGTLEKETLRTKYSHSYSQHISDESLLSEQILTFRNARVGDIVSFGEYEQDNNKSNRKEKIEWLVLSKEHDKMLVISRYAIDAMPYNKHTFATWQFCAIRRFLNGDFLETAFNPEEQKFIINSIVPADKNPKYNSPSGNDTKDKVFLLSIPEANKYFQSSNARQCIATKYAKNKGAYGNILVPYCDWWLRSPGNRNLTVAYVDSTGFVDCRGDDMLAHKYAVRPALWIDLVG